MADRSVNTALASAIAAAQEASRQAMTYRENLPVAPPADGTGYQPIVQNFYAAARRESAATVALRWVMLGVVVVGLLVVLSMFLMAFAIACAVLGLVVLILFRVYRDWESRR